MVKRLSIIVVIAALCSCWAGEVRFHPIQLAGIENAFVVATNVYSGSAPEGDEAFETLKRLGVKTIITVDGTKPDIERAHKFGMRYVHLPHGYDGIPDDTEKKLVKAAETSEGGIFIHCHHGKHRGPATVAIICMAREGWSAAEGERWLVAAGTSTNYQGLYESVRDFRPPSRAELAALPDRFPELAQLSSLVGAMVAIDNTFDHLKAIRAAGNKTPTQFPDLSPANEATILREHFRELQRSPQAQTHGPKFLDALQKSENDAQQLDELFRGANIHSPENITLANKLFDSLANRCASCHKTWRDHPIKAQPN